MRPFLALLLTLLCVCPARAYRRPLNPRYKKRLPPGEVAFSTAAVKVVAIDRLRTGRWDPKIKLTLELFAADRGKGSASYDPENPPAAVLAWDDAALDGDVGEQVFRRLVERAEFKFDDAWWNLVPLAYGRQRMRAAQEQFIALSSAAWTAQPTYHQFQKYALESYQDSCRKVDRKDCRLYLARLLKGFSREELSDYARDVIAAEKARSLAIEEIGESAQDPKPLTARRGLREVPEMKDLCRLLLTAGIDVWVIDLEPQDLLLAAVAGYGVKPSRVVGIKQASFRERLSEKISLPVPYRAGKVDAVLSKIGRAPDIVVGASEGDAELMDYGKGMRLLLDRGDKVLRARAKKNGWLIQKSFAEPPSQAASGMIRSP